MQLTYFDHLKIISTNWGIAFVLFGLTVSLSGVWWLYHSIKNRPQKMAVERVIGAILLIISGLAWSYLQTLIPTRYAVNPTRAMYQTNAQVAEAIRPIYDDHCAMCHGDQGLGDGPIATYMMPPPANFAVHGWHHREGEHYWWITQGITGTGMPSFAGVLSEEERWLLARFVRQLGREARVP